jgi:hypothetical protein
VQTPKEQTSVPLVHPVAQHGWFVSPQVAHCPDESHVHMSPLEHVAVQSVQRPLEPQLVGAKPELQVPPVAALQQPPLHGWLAPQAVVHRWVLVSQA